jgi:glycosyltransferase involved in cell wall biosynthesis
MNMLDMGVIASLGSETIARVAFELIACHTPIIGSNVGVMPDILDRECLFEPAKIDEMANLFVNVLDNDFREKSLQSALNKFYHNNTECSFYGWTLEDFYTKTVQVYKDILNSSSGDKK